MTAKVCMLTSAHHPVLDPRIFYKESTTLHAAGYDITVIGPHTADSVESGIKIRAFPRAKNRFERILLTPWRILARSLKENACVYHFHDPDLIPMGLLLKLFGAKVVYDVH